MHLNQSSLDKVEMYVLVHSVVAFVLLKQTAELIHVVLVEGIQFLSRWLLIPLHSDWPPNCSGEVQHTRFTLRLCNLVC